MDFRRTRGRLHRSPTPYSSRFLSDPLLNEHIEEQTVRSAVPEGAGAGRHAKAQELSNGVRRYQIDQGGTIVWAFSHSADTCSHKVRGYGEAGSGWLTGNDDERTWRWGFA